jgi:hypothetical protein
MFECWLTINGKILSKFKGSYSFLSQGIVKLGFLTFHQNLPKFPSIYKGCVKMDIKGRERKRNEKGSA